MRASALLWLPLLLAVPLELGGQTTESGGARTAAAARRVRKALPRVSTAPQRIRCLYNGYLLTIDPVRAVDPA